VARRTATAGELGSDKWLIVRRNQFLISRIDARKGAAGVVPENLDGAFVSNDFPAFNVNSDRLVPQFLGWYSKTARFVEDCKAASEGTTNRVRLKEHRFLAMSIPLPSLEEQRRISKALDSVSAGVDAMNALGMSIARQHEALVVALHLSASNSRVVSMGDLVTLDEDQIPVERTSRYPQVGVRGFGKGLFEREVLEGTNTTYRHFNRLHSGYLLLSQVKGWEGAVAVCDSKFDRLFVSPEYRTFRCKPDGVLPEYLAILVRNDWFYRKLSTITRGVGARRERIRPEKFLEMRLEMPTVDSQLKVLSVLEKLKGAASMHSCVEKKMTAVLPATIARVFSAGESRL